MRRWRADNPEAARKGSRRRAQKKREWLQRLKVERGCTDCGYDKHPAALEFDHRDGGEKDFILARCSSYGWDRIREEVDKCEVVCANCHRIRTVERGQTGRVEGVA